MRIELNLNGEETSWEVAPGTTLLAALHQASSLSAEDSCLRGHCGSCTVLLGGRPVHSCLVMAARVSGCSVTTIEGLPGEGREGLVRVIRGASLEKAIELGCSEIGWEQKKPSTVPHLERCIGRSDESSPQFGVQFVDLEVDPETGEVFLRKIVSAVDGGTMSHPLMTDKQIEGAVVQGLEYALFENDEASGPFGAKAAGEVPIDGPAQAIINAISDAVGIHINRIPATPERIWRAIKESKEES
ncbi:MAG: molybdopterin-dependent oxidoreductase [Gemmatimonadales bacterium]|nr:molybdopterin-dependent oxidoreductase [Gemmatimonadales bacterium]